MDKHTPGPWFGKVNGKFNHDRNYWSLDDEEAVCSEYAPITLEDGTVIGFAVASGEDFFADDRVSANASLMSAAPDLLEALEALTANYDDVTPGESSNVDIARAAIAKARGTT